MWLALVMFCSGPDAVSCDVMANTTTMHMTEEQCVADYTMAAQALVLQGAHNVKAVCFKIGEFT